MLTTSSWDICQEGHSPRSTPQRRHMAHQRLVLSGHAQETREVIKTHGPPETVCSQSTWSPEILRPGKCTKRPAESVPSQSTQESERQRPGRCMTCRVCFGQYPCTALWSLSSIDPGSTCRHERGQTQRGPELRALPTLAREVCLQCPSLSTTQENKGA